MSKTIFCEMTESKAIKKQWLSIQEMSGVAN